MIGVYNKCGNTFQYFKCQYCITQQPGTLTFAKISSPKKCRKEAKQIKIINSTIASCYNLVYFVFFILTFLVLFSELVNLLFHSIIHYFYYFQYIKNTSLLYISIKFTFEKHKQMYSFKKRKQKLSNKQQKIKFVVL